MEDSDCRRGHTVIGTGRPSRQCIAWSGAVVAALAVGAYALSPHQRAEPPATRSAPSYDMTIAGVRSEIVADGRRQLTASAASVHVAPAPLLGPFHLGFLPALSASGVAIDLARKTEAPDPVAWDLRRHLAQLTAAAGHPLVPFDVNGISVTASDENQLDILLQAERCRSTLLSPAVRCERGQLRVRDALHSFRLATFDGARWRLDDESLTRR